MIPIIMTAFGTTSDAITTYSHIDQVIRGNFPAEEIVWAYSSKRVTRELQQHSNTPAIHLEEAFCQLKSRGISKVIVQSLHLFPGSEFHGIHHTTKHSGLSSVIGNPLLTAEQDYHELGNIFQPLISAGTGKAILILGHGTHHPVWTAYYCLEKILRRRFGDKIFVGVVEKSPDSNHLIHEILEHGYNEVCVIPLFLVHGMHYRRDIISDAPESWVSRLKSKGIVVNLIHQSLGLMPGVAELFVRHIAEAREKLIRME